MLVIHSGTNVYAYDKTSGKFVKLPLTYNIYPTEPTPEALNEALAWLLDFLKRKSLPYTVLVDEEQSKGPMEPVSIVYADITTGSTVKHTLALYTVAAAITTGTTKSLEQTLYEELT